jgi:chromosome segregation ATPase
MEQVNHVLDVIPPVAQPAAEIGSGSSSFEAYRLVTFALLTITKYDSMARSKYQSENADLKERISNLIKQAEDSAVSHNFSDRPIGDEVIFSDADQTAAARCTRTIDEPKKDRDSSERILNDDELKRRVAVLSQENSNGRATIADLTSHIDHLSQSLLAMRQEHAQHAAELQELEQHHLAEVRSVCQTVRKLKKKLTSELVKRTHLEALCGDLRSAQETAEGEREVLLSELSAARAYRRAMLEEIARERATAEANTRVAEFAVETAQRQIADGASAAAECRVRKMLASLTERTCTVIPFVGQPTEVAVLGATVELVRIVRER